MGLCSYCRQRAYVPDARCGKSDCDAKEVGIISSNRHDVIVVGAGVAGLTSAAYLCKEGHRVLVVEKEHQSGGLLGSFTIDGHIVDRGARGIIDSGIFTPMAKQLGLAIDQLPNPVRIAVGEHSVDFRDKTSIDEYGRLLAKLYPGHAPEIDRIIAEIKRVMGYMDVLYGIENPLFVPKPYDKEYLLRTLLPWTMRFMLNVGRAMKLLDPINDHLRKITANESLINIITQHFFAGTPAFFALSYFSLYLDYLYPRGSTQTIVDQLVRIVTEHGGHIANGQEVVSIDADKRMVATREGHEYAYDQLLWAADLNMMYRCLNPSAWPDSPLKTKVLRQQEFLRTKKGADSVLSLHLIVKQPPEKFGEISGPHVFFTPSPQGLAGISLSDLMNENGSFTSDGERILKWLDAFVKQNTLEISIPSLRDASLSPPGECALIVSFLMDYQLTRHIADLGIYEAFKKRIAALVMESLDGYYPQFSKHVSRTVMTTPLTIAARTNNTEGSLTGWSFTNKPFPAEYRFLKVSKSVLTPVDNIKQAGQWAFNPAGVPVSILTGKLAADAVAKDLKKKGTKGEKR